MKKNYTTIRTANNKLFILRFSLSLILEFIYKDRMKLFLYLAGIYCNLYMIDKDAMNL